MSINYLAKLSNCSDELTSGWHGKDKQKSVSPPVLTHMIGKPRSVSFMMKSLANHDVETGVFILLWNLNYKKERRQCQR
jgi:hypothetical protein